MMSNFLSKETYLVGIFVLPFKSDPTSDHVKSDRGMRWAMFGDESMTGAQRWFPRGVILLSSVEIFRYCRISQGNRIQHPAAVTTRNVYVG
jgi:hypothetical protein